MPRRSFSSQLSSLCCEENAHSTVNARGVTVFVWGGGMSLDAMEEVTGSFFLAGFLRCSAQEKPSKRILHASPF